LAVFSTPEADLQKANFKSGHALPLLLFNLQLGDAAQVF